MIYIKIMMILAMFKLLELWRLEQREDNFDLYLTFVQLESAWTLLEPGRVMDHPQTVKVYAQKSVHNVNRSSKRWWPGRDRGYGSW